MKINYVFIFLFLVCVTLDIHTQVKDRQLGQPVLMALPTGIGNKDPLTTYQEYPEVQAVATSINQILTERKLEVRDLKQQLTLFDKLRSKMNTLNSDPNALIAANSGADIYLEFAIEIIKEGPGNKVRVDINVKETATAKLLGASSGQSDAIVTSDISSLCQIAANNCIDRVMEQIRGYWSEIPVNGKPVLITFSSKNTELNKITYNGKKFDRELTNALKILTISYRREMSTSNTIQFNPVYIDAFKYDDVEEFSYAIQDFLDMFALTYNAQIEGKSIEIEIN
jgi:hypothetical protein